MASDTTSRAAELVTDLCRELIRFDTSNYGDGSGPGERKAAEWTAERLTDAGLTPEIYESEPGRATVVARWAGEDSSRPGLLLHGHLDVVPAEASDWQVDPFAGEIRDGCLWGRGAVDMKDMDAMILSVLQAWTEQGRRPPRDVVLCFLADEEAGGVLGSKWIAREHPELFEGCSEAVSEVGGFSITTGPDRRLYAIETAEKGLAWMRLTATGRAGHGSMVNRDNAVTALAEALARIGSHSWPTRLIPTVEAFLVRVGEELGTPFDPAAPEELVARLGPLGAIVGATLRNTAAPTVLRAGYKTNVIPQIATAEVDGRFLPGHEEEFFATIDELLGDRVTREMLVHDIALETPFDGSLVDAMRTALQAEDPGCDTVPYCLSGGTDNKAFSTLGMRGFGFSPLQLPSDLDFPALFHGVDERVPVDGLQFGARVLDRFLALS
ncbi:MAG: M20/M25/M40 family metallo-hydrolase [Actinomycetes bacterium]